MKTTRLVTSISLLIVTLACLDAGAAPDLRKEVKLTSDGSSATFMAPNWRAEKTEDALAVFERAPNKAKKISFGLLVLAIEEGPKTTKRVDWEQVVANIVTTAKAAGSALVLEVGLAFPPSKGMVGKRLSGTTTVGERTVKVEIIALIAPNVLLTISSVGRMDDVGVADLATAVAATARVISEP